MPIPKYGGRDCELSTTGVSEDGIAIDPAVVTREVLGQIAPAVEAYGARVWSRDTAGWNGGFSPYSMDCLRHWASGGQCHYADMCHAETCTASCLYPSTFAAQCISTLLTCEAARRLAEQQAHHGARYSLSTSNADLVDPAISFGTHISMTVASSLWDDLFVEHRHPAILGFVASAMAAAIPFFGAGYLLPLKDGTTIYSLAARAHHLSKIDTLPTTQPFQRGLLNSRREPHGTGFDRLHLIGFDYCIGSSALLFSLLQCLLAAAEEGYCGMNLFEPVRAMRLWSWHLDPQTGKLPATATLIDGRQLTLPQYIRELAATLLQMCEGHLITENVAPEAKDMLPRIIDLSHYCEEGSLAHSGRHLSWAAKLLWLTRLCADDGVALGDATTRLADHDFCNTDPRRGTFWQLWEQGLVDPLVEMSDAEACLVEGPPESRDWGRGQLIQRFHNQITGVDWSYVNFRGAAYRWSPQLRIELPQMDSLNKQSASLIQSASDPTELSRLLESDGRAVASEDDPVDNVTRNLLTHTEN